MKLLSTIPPAVWVVLITPLVFALAARGEAAQVSRDADGWFRLRPSAALIVLGLTCFPMVWFAFVLLFDAVSDSETGKLFAGVLMVAVSLGGLYMAFAMDIRFNDSGVQYGGLSKTAFAPWVEIKRIRYHPFWGPQVVTDRFSVLIPRFFRGFRQLMDEAARRGIEIPQAFRREAS
jgi:hypothetical protein